MAYDAALKTVVLFGGFSWDHPLGDTWVWDGKRWLKGQIGPTARCSPAMAYDAAREQVLMFSGDCAWLLDDTWIWNRAWTQAFPQSSPPGRWRAGMTYDAARGQIVLFGGQGSRDGGDLVRKDTWTWDGATWTKHHSAVSPIGRMDAGMAYDDARQQVVLFGGLDQTGSAIDQTWTWDGLRWIRVLPEQYPPARSRAAMAYDAAAGKIVLFGGEDGHGVLFGDTWTWDGSTWHTR